jgi:predicted aspartyl protease
MLKLLQSLSPGVLAVFALLPAVLSAAEEIPFDPVRGLVEVPVMIDGQARGTFGIDTGADRLYIDSSFAARHGLTFVNTGRQRPIVGLDGFSEASSVDLRSVRIGREALYNLRATAIDLRKIIQDQRKGMPDGLIGRDILQRFYVTVDFPNRLIKLELGQPDFMRQADSKLPPFVRFTTNRHLILIDVTLDDSVTVPMFLDYCASYTALSPALAARLGLNPEASEPQRVTRMSVEGLIETENVPIIVADFTRFKQSVKRAEFEGIIGASFLYRHKLTVDYKAKRIYIHTK